jgi:hypothetical protein
MFLSFPRPSLILFSALTSFFLSLPATWAINFVPQDDPAGLLKKQLLYCPQLLLPAPHAAHPLWARSSFLHADFPREPQAFLDFTTRLRSFEAVENPFTRQEMVLLLENLAHDMIGAAENDAFARSSLPHIRDLQNWVIAFKEYFLSQGLDPAYFFTLVTAHDMGKFIPDPRVLNLAQRWAQQKGLPAMGFVWGRVSWHDQSTVAYLIMLGERLGIPPSKIEHLIVDIIGHNDGSGLPDVWWNKTGWPADLMGNYSLPRNKRALYLAFLDRIGQGNRDGAEKIYRQLLTTHRKGDNRNAPFLRFGATAAYHDNPQATILQLESIAGRLKAEGVEDFFQAPLYRAAMDEEQGTLMAYDRLQWIYGPEGKPQALLPLSDGENSVRANTDFFVNPDFQKKLWDGTKVVKPN